MPKITLQPSSLDSQHQSLWKSYQHQNYLYCRCERAEECMYTENLKISIRITSTVIVEELPASELLQQLLWKCIQHQNLFYCHYCGREGKQRSELILFYNHCRRANESNSKLLWFTVGVPCALLKGFKEKMHT